MAFRIFIAILFIGLAAGLNSSRASAKVISIEEQLENAFVAQALDLESLDFEWNEATAERARAWLATRQRELFSDLRQIRDKTSHEWVLYSKEGTFVELVSELAILRELFAHLDQNPAQIHALMPALETYHRRALKSQHHAPDHAP